MFGSNDFVVKWLKDCQKKKRLFYLNIKSISLQWYLFLWFGLKSENTSSEILML